MGIDAELRSERGEILAEVDDARMVMSHACGNEFVTTRLLKYLVPWGDAVFNQAQALDLEQDINLLLTEHQGTPLAGVLLRVRVLVERLASESHVYLWFVGD